MAAPCLIFGQAIGRIGCYFAGCCYGIETTDVALQVFPLSVQLENGSWHLATFFYESFFNILGFVVLLILALSLKRKGIVTSWYFIIYGTVRAVLEQFRDPSELLTIGSTGIRASQALSVLLIIIGITLFVWALLSNKNKKIDEAK